MARAMTTTYDPTYPKYFDDADASKPSKGEQEQVVNECFHGKICYVKYPYTPPHEWELDYPRLMLRAEAVRHRNGTDGPATEQLAKKAMARTDLVGPDATKA